MQTSKSIADVQKAVADANKQVRAGASADVGRVFSVARFRP
ncbi:hypothetical protein [Streptomyces hygroscopicus]|nr:hypothetical protein [Streptomyces hygroscopicus]